MYRRSCIATGATPGSCLPPWCESVVFFPSRRRHTRLVSDWSSDVCSSDLGDTGIGIADEDQARIFEDFTQADSSSTRAFGGAGLGLSISRRLVTMLGGQLTLTSKVGKGSTFTLSVPRSMKR